MCRIGVDCIRKLKGALSCFFAGLQYRQCLEFLDEMTELGIQKNVVIFGAATSCMEKCGKYQLTNVAVLHFTVSN